ncbi:MAG: ABC-ATPase domain-containing protein [Lachnospiraceae bacterium]|nr:ABC-ATPase domain-containing protein [Lachnospiraceae bacterium]
MKQSNELRELLKRIDHKGYPAYKDTRGEYQFPDYILSIDHVQGDPFAAPSSVSVRIDGRKARFPEALYDTPWKRIALQDELLRQFGKHLEHYSFQVKGSGKSGLLSVSRPGQEILDRSGCQMDPKTGMITCRFEIGFPASGRTIQAFGLEKILFQLLPDCIRKGLFYASLNGKQLQDIADLADQQQFIRDELKKRDLVAFVADGSILPRESGISNRPMKDAFPFVSPASLALTLELPHGKVLTGMGIPKGITLIVGGGYHGKSTLLKALETGVYNHISGDGREFVLTDESAMKLRAEDGRSVTQVDISMFIGNLPNGKDTASFSTPDASGSTSQAAAVIESMEAGSQVLLMDEDTSATNFMIRDELMQRVVHKNAEPITPFIDQIRPLYEKYGLSTILVAGSSGSFFTKADVILQMKNYEPMDITEFAREETRQYFHDIHGVMSADSAPDTNAASTDTLTGSKPKCHRILKPQKGLGKNDRIKIHTLGCEEISINHDAIDLRCVEQLVDPEQLNTLARLYVYASQNLMDGHKTLREVVEQLSAQLSQQSFAIFGRDLSSSLALPRKEEIFAMFYRSRK